MRIAKVTLGGQVYEDVEVRFEEYAAYFYDRLRYKLPSEEARIFFDVLASEGNFHAMILKQQIEIAFQAAKLPVGEPVLDSDCAAARTRPRNPSSHLPWP